MRAASPSHVVRCVKKKCQRPPRRIKSTNISAMGESPTARYLRVESGHAVTGVHLLRTNKIQDSECWWCSSSKQSVAHVVLECYTRRKVRCRAMQPHGKRSANQAGDFRSHLLPWSMFRERERGTVTMGCCRCEVYHQKRRGGLGISNMRPIFT